MAILNDEVKKDVLEEFKKLTDDVNIYFFTQTFECDFCAQTHQLLKELVQLSPKLKLYTYNFQLDKEKVEEFKIDKIPAIVLQNSNKKNVRFFGIPSGYEFASLINDIIELSNKEPKLHKKTIEKLKDINKPVHIQVFVTPTCPYCPQAVITAHRFAMVNDLITADMVEVTEFPYLANKYNVQGVPKTVFNEKTELIGAVPESMFFKALQKAIK